MLELDWHIYCEKKLGKIFTDKNTVVLVDTLQEQI